MFRRIFVSFLVFSFLFSGFSGLNFAQAGNNIFPVELAIPNQPLHDGEEANFFIIINDKEIKEKIEYFNFFMGSNDKDPIKVPYAGQNFIKLTENVPTFAFANKIQNRVEAFSSEDKNLFKIIKNTDYILKYPFGPLPGKFNAGIEDSLKSEHFSFTKLRADHSEGESGFLGSTNRYISEGFMGDFDKNLSKEKLAERIENTKKDITSSVTAAYDDESGAVVNYEEIKPIDKMIEKVYLINAYNSYNVKGTDHYYYTCEADVFVILNNEDSDSQKIYPFNFRKRGENVTPGEYQGQIDEFSEMARNFAKNITMRKYPDKEVEDLMQKIYPGKIGNLHHAFEDYDLDSELQSSDIYELIMAGGEPGVEKIAKKKKEMKDREFEISFKFNNETSIWNSGVVNTGTDKDTSFAISLNIDGKAFDKDGEEIEVSDEELYKDVYLMYEIINPKSQIYFQEASIGDNKLKVKVDDVFESQYLQSIGPILYKGPYLPTEYVSVSLVDKNEDVISKRFIYKVYIKDASPRIEMEKDIVEIDDVADSIFKFKIIDEYHDKVECSVKIPYEKYQRNKIPFIKVSEEGQGAVSTQVQPFECETNEWISIRVQPPKLSNFNMLSELNGLNMWDLQRGTMETFALDLVAFAVDRRMASLGKSKAAMSGLYEKGYTGAKGALGRADKIEKTIRSLDRANSLAGSAQNAIKISQIKANLDSHVKDIDNATGGDSSTVIDTSMAESGSNIVESTAKSEKERIEKGLKSSLEAGYDWGIAGINILQSTVGTIAMVPGHIPFVGKYAQKVTGTFSLVFNLMTNVWKGNLEYLSKEKKLDRAQEKKIPYPALVGVSTKDGFSDTGAQVITVLYNYLEN